MTAFHSFATFPSTSHLRPLEVDLFRLFDAGVQRSLCGEKLLLNERNAIRNGTVPLKIAVP